jgi:WD40 repeat protein
LKGSTTSVAFSKQGDYFASGGEDQQVCIELRLSKNSLFSVVLKVLLWKTNFDTDPPLIESTSNKNGNSNDHTIRPRVALQQDRSQITSLREKSQPETSDERRARKVIFEISLSVVISLM